MNGKIVQERIEEIKEWAGQNKNHISRRMVYDILKEKNTQFEDQEIAEICFQMEEDGIWIDEIDEETVEDGTFEEDSLVPAEVSIGVKHVSLDMIVSRIQYDEIDLSPDFQRRPGLWSDVQKSRLIESLMLRIPLPAFYFDASDENKWIVIDGLQRLSALKGFMLTKSFKLTGLEYLRELEDLQFEELPRQYVRRINETQLTLYTVEKGTPRRIVFNIFRRLNTGGLALNSQEIRHALNQGTVIKLIRDMAECEEFRIATEYSIKKERMQDCEYATRFIAFTQLDLQEYKGNIDDFLDLAMSRGNHMTTIEQSKILDSYKRALAYCHSIFGKYAFRRVRPNRTRGPINKALFETFMKCVSEYDDDKLNMLVKRATDVQTEYVSLINDPMYIACLKAGDRYTVGRRIQLTGEFFERLLND